MLSNPDLGVCSDEHLLRQDRLILQSTPTFSLMGTWSGAYSKQDEQLEAANCFLGKMLWAGVCFCQLSLEAL